MYETGEALAYRHFKFGLQTSHMSTNVSMTDYPQKGIFWGLVNSLNFGKQVIIYRKRYTTET